VVLNLSVLFGEYFVSQVPLEHINQVVMSTIFRNVPKNVIRKTLNNYFEKIRVPLEHLGAPQGVCVPHSKTTAVEECVAKGQIAIHVGKSKKFPDLLGRAKRSYKMSPRCIVALTVK